MRSLQVFFLLLCSAVVEARAPKEWAEKSMCIHAAKKKTAMQNKENRRDALVAAAALKSIDSDSVQLEVMLCPHPSRAGDSKQSCVKFGDLDSFVATGFVSRLPEDKFKTVSMAT